MKAKTEAEIRAIVAGKIERALSWQGSALSRDRAKALRYYRGEKFGNEVDGRSQIVSRDVAEVVDGMLPAILRPFVSGEEVVRFEPKGPEDERLADQATDYANYVWAVDNPGFRVFHDWIKDGLLGRVGVVKVWWESATESVREDYSGLTADEVGFLRLDPAVEMVEQEREENGAGTPPTYRVALRRTIQGGRILVRNVPPEEFLTDGERVSLDDKPFCAHRCRRTVSDLVAMGYDRTRVMAIAAGEGGALDRAWDRQERARPEGSPAGGGDTADDSQRELWVSECYLPLDADGDGIAEYRKITVAGDQAELLLEDHEVDDHPFAAWSPYPIPHKFHGESVADKVMDVQLTKSAILRQMLDNLYLVNNARTEIVEGKVNLDDFLSSKPGGYIRVREAGAMREIAVPPVFQHAFPALEYLDTVRENRSGATRYNQGLDADSLNKTASGINAIMGAAAMRVELIARIFAETGVRRAFRLILRLLVRHQDKARVVRLRNQWIAVDPRAWNAEMDVGVSVGLGTGNRDQQLGHLLAIWDKQVQAMQLQGGPDGALVSLRNLYETASKIVHNAGVKTAQGFFNDPSLVPPPLPAPPPVDPVAMEAQARVALENRKLDAEIALKLRKHEDEIALRRLELALKFGAPPMGMPEGMTRGLSPGGLARGVPDMPPGASAAAGPAPVVPSGMPAPATSQRGAA
jgi:hypothetical protein